MVTPAPRRRALEYTQPRHADVPAVGGGVHLIAAPDNTRLRGRLAGPSYNDRTAWTSGGRRVPGRDGFAARKAIKAGAIQLQTEIYDVIVVGSGAAGAMA